MKNQFKLNSRLLTLLHLRHMDEEAEGKMHFLNVLFPNLSAIAKWEIFKNLADAKFIEVEGEKPPLNLELASERKFRSSGRLPMMRLWGKITFPGRLYLLEEIKMQVSGKYNINFDEWAAENIIIDKSEKLTVYSRPDCLETIDRIIETLKTDQSISKEEKKNLIDHFRHIRGCVDQYGQLHNKFYDGSYSYREVDSIINLTNILWLNMWSVPEAEPDMK